MNAKELFFNLGYLQTIDDKNQICYELPYTNQKIIFVKVLKGVNLENVDCLTYREVKAIEKQLEELKK